VTIARFSTGQQLKPLQASEPKIRIQKAELRTQKPKPKNHSQHETKMGLAAGFSGN